MDKYIVVGNPIAQSKSPDIHALFAEQTKQNMEYDRLLVADGDFEHTIKAFFKRGGKGLNITAPFKGDAFEFADTLTERAKLACAVNTLFLNDSGQIIGDTTDGLGLVADILGQSWDIKSRRILILGAGGAVRGVLQPLLEQDPEQIHIANRTEAKARAIADSFQSFGHVTASDLDSLDALASGFDLVINGSSAGLSGRLPQVSESIFTAHPCVYDMSYAASLTPFLTWAKDHGVQRYSDGLGMLVEQAAESFFIWRGVRPDVKSVVQVLKTQL